MKRKIDMVENQIWYDLGDYKTIPGIFSPVIIS